jgi:hypothetical protein
MTMEQEAVTIVNDLLDREKARYRLDEAGLAAHLNVSRATVYRWRQGDIGLLPRVLLPRAFPAPAAPSAETVKRIIDGVVDQLRIPA